MTGDAEKSSRTVGASLDISLEIARPVDHGLIDELTTSDLFKLGILQIFQGQSHDVSPNLLLASCTTFLIPRPLLCMLSVQQAFGTKAFGKAPSRPAR